MEVVESFETSVQYQSSERHRNHEVINGRLNTSSVEEQEACINAKISEMHYTGCHRRKGQNFGRVFLMLNYTEKPQNTYIQS
jgi:hypothetical protein